MKTEQLKLTQVRINDANPREIKQDKFRRLVDSLLVFPKMLEIRPAVIDAEYKLLGGNQRTQALREIAKMSIEQIADRLCGIADFAAKTEDERKALVEYWAEWLDKPTITIVRADHLTEDEKKQFVVKDNVSFGTWDYDMLSANWDSAKLQDWGMDVWNEGAAVKDPMPEDVQTEDEEPDFSDAMPEELQGVDLNPSGLEKLHGTDERPNDYVIITFEPQDKDKLMEFLGIKPENWNEKVCYTIDEILFMKGGAE